VPELRWILTAIGLALIVGVYLWSRRDRGQADEDDRLRREPAFGERRDPWDRAKPVEEPLPELGVNRAMEPARAAHTPPVEAESQPPPPAGDELIVALRIRARRVEGLDGSDLVKAFSAERLEYGKFGAFHSLDERRRSRFLVASLVEPGSFEIEKMHELRCPGVSMFMVLPGPREPLSALEDMLTCARRLAERLDAEVLDDKGNPLTMQHAGWLREQVVEHHRRSKLAGGAAGGGSEGSP
jgi:cell division protein ZipA